MRKSDICYERLRYLSCSFQISKTHKLDIYFFILLETKMSRNYSSLLDICQQNKVYLFENYLLSLQHIKNQNQIYGNIVAAKLRKNVNNSACPHTFACRFLHNF